MGSIKVYIVDTGVPYDQAEEYFAEISAWATRQCATYINYHVQDVTDLSDTNDFIAEYRFGNPNDALLFQLKWQLS